MFEVDNKYSPIAIGVEADGLHEFIMQPLRQEQTKRGQPLPIRELMAPKDRRKVDFIKSLQPFFKAGDVEFAGEPGQFEDLASQLLSFPTGKIDAPNALAYFLRLKPGVPMYEDFTAHHIMETAIPISRRHQAYLALNASPQCTTGALVQIFDGVLTVHAAFVQQGDPGMALMDIVKEAGAIAGTTFVCVAPPIHFQSYDNIGLRPAARKLKITLSLGGQEIKGREELRQLLKGQSPGKPAFRVSPRATWFLRAASGGYARELGHDQAKEGVYRTLCEGLEAFAATLQSGSVGGDDKDLRYDYTADGRKYISARG